MSDLAKLEERVAKLEASVAELERLVVALTDPVENGDLERAHLDFAARLQNEGASWGT
jgi:hypothetical protein